MSETTKPEANVTVKTTSGIFTTESVDPPKTIYKGDIKMADIVTGTVTGLVNNLPETTLKEISDTRREVASDTAAIQLENMKGFDRVNADVQRAELSGVSATKDARFDIVSKIEGSTETVKDRLFAVGRDTMELRAQVSALSQVVRDNAALSALQSEKAVLENTVEMQKQTTYLSDKIGGEGEKTRDLINDLKYHDLNRGLVERNAEIVELANDRRHWRHVAEQGQWANLQNQLQAFQSQLSTATNGMVNFGTMAGVGQSSTSNNVR